MTSQPAKETKLAIETLEQGEKDVHTGQRKPLF